MTRPPSSPLILAILAIVFLFAAPVTTKACPIAGAKTCGACVTRAPSTVGVSGSSMVDVALGVKAFTDLRNAVICLLNAERTSRGLPALGQNKALDKAALGHTGEAQRLKWWTGGANPHVNPEIGSIIDGRAVSSPRTAS